jgi:hypothetical protein
MKTQKVWVMRDLYGNCTHGILEINEQSTWVRLQGILLAVHGKANTIDAMKSWGTYTPEMIDIPVKEQSEQ